MKKFLSYILIAASLLSATSCLDDEYMFDYDNMGEVIEFMTETNKSTINCKNLQGQGSFWVNYTINYAQDIKEDISVTVSLDESLLSAGQQVLPASAYSVSVESYAKTASGLSFPAELVIPEYKKQALSERVDWNNRRNAQGTVIVNAQGINPGTYYLPLRIKDVSPSVAPISGNFGTQVIIINVQ